MMDESALLKLLEKHADMNTCDLASALNETQENILSKLNELEQDEYKSCYGFNRSQCNARA